MDKRHPHVHHIGADFMPEIQRMMILSTGHLFEGTASDMEGPTIPSSLQTVTFNSVNQGFLVWTGESLEQSNIDAAPESLRACMEYARHFKVDYIMFDEAGPRVPFLSWFEW